MANQNLSEFGEKLFVADADHTFIWDSAASISKRVSRNSWLNSGTLTSDAPVTISQTWNAVGQTFKALVVNAAGTSDANSASGSLLLDLQVNGVSKFRVGKLTNAVVEFATNGNGATLRGTNLQFGILGGALVAGVTSSAFYVGILEAPSYLFSDAANTLALRNGTSAQTFNVYGTYTSSTSYERLTLSALSAANAIIGTNKGSGGGTARGLDLHTDGTARMTITTAGNVGIGTTAPDTKLSIEDSSAATRAGITNTNNSVFGAGFFFRTLSGGSVVSLGTIRTGNDGNLALFTGTTAANETEKLRILASGNVGIGTTSPTSKLQVTGGDVEIETVTSGIIMKAAGTSTRYRITLNAGGTALVFTAI